MDRVREESLQMRTDAVLDNCKPESDRGKEPASSCSQLSKALWTLDARLWSPKL